jgi:hypothetical protein
MIELLDLNDIAEMYRVPRRHARDFIVKQPNFPAPVPGSSGRFQRWSATEVRAFINRRHAKSVNIALQAA